MYLISITSIPGQAGFSRDMMSSKLFLGFALGLVPRHRESNSRRCSKGPLDESYAEESSIDQRGETGRNDPRREKCLDAVR
jgi:hypothetical protein